MEGEERRCGPMRLRDRTNPRTPFYFEEGALVLHEYVHMAGNPPKNQGAGCAWRNRRGRGARTASEGFMRAPCQSRSKEYRHDVLWRKKVGEKDVLLGVHIIGRSPSTRGLPSRSMRRGLQVKNKTGLHGFLPKGTWLPGAIYGLEYTQKEVSHFKQKYKEDKNIMWALEHSLVELPPMTPVRDSSSQAPHRGASFSPYCPQPPRQGQGTRICMREWMVGVEVFPYSRDPPIVPDGPGRGSPTRGPRFSTDRCPDQVEVSTPRSAALHTIRCSKPGDRIYWLDPIEGSNGQERPAGCIDQVACAPPSDGAQEPPGDLGPWPSWADKAWRDHPPVQGLSRTSHGTL
eukprot:scaffold828_cov302-Pavlova_lutheri.AAC.4